MCVKPFRMNRNKSPLDVPTGWGTVTLREMKDKFFLKSHCSHLEFLWLLENHRQGIKDKLVRKANNQDWKKKIKNEVVHTKPNIPSHKGFQSKNAHEESSLLAWVWVSLLQEFSSCFEATYESFFPATPYKSKVPCWAHICKYYQSVADFG